MKTRIPLVPALLVMIATLLAALVVVRVAFALDSDAARFEAESMSENSSSISVVDDNGTQALRFVNSPASASKSVSFSANAQMAQIRVRGVDRSGTTRTLPSLRVSVDGAQILSQQVSGSYSTLTAPISVGAGNHTVSVNMTNQDTGDRIFVDWIAFTYSEAPPPSQCPEGKYLATYRNESAAQAFSTQPVLSRCESAPLNYGWGTSSPAPGVNADDFTVLWKGNFDFEGGEYTFSARSDDGIRVYVDGTRIMDAFFDQSATDRQSTRTLTAGTHEVKVEYYENGGDAVARLSWVKVASEPPPSECPEGNYLATYRNEAAGQFGTTSPVLTRCEAAPLAYNLGAGSPAPGVNADNFTAVWKGDFNFEAAVYEFTAHADDGIRLYIDGERILDEWRDQSAADFRATRTLTTGTHEVKIEYYEKGVDSVAKLSWVKLAAPPPPFVQRCGLHLCLEGGRWTPHGASVTVYKYPGELEAKGEPQRTMELARGANLNIVRIVNFLDEGGDPASEPFNEQRLVVLDRYIAEAEKNGLGVAIDLSTYRNLLAKRGINPYTHDWSRFLVSVMNRTNTQSGRIYRNDPTIAFWLLAGEAESPGHYGMSNAQYVAGFKQILAKAQSIDTNHLISTGGFLHLNGNTVYPWQEIFSLPENDFCSIHTYSMADQQETIPKVSQYCSGIGKMWLQEEFGATQAQGDWTPCTNPSYCGDKRRADSFQRVYDVSRNANTAGILFWNLGVDVQGVNKQGDTYDVNPDTPLTWEVVRRNAPPAGGGMVAK